MVYTVNSLLKDTSLRRTPSVGASLRDEISAQSLEFYSKSWANKVIKLVIIWLQKDKGGKKERT